MALSSKQTRHLRALAHSLKPLVQIGDKGLTQAVFDAVDEQLEHHELIKVKMAGAEREDVKEAAAALSGRTSSEVAQIIGRTIVLYRRRAKKPAIRLPS